MAMFEVGKKYSTTSACDSNCTFTVEIVKRTAKTVTFLRNGQERRAKVYTDRDGEYIIPERYSMAPVFRACREYEEPPVVEAPAPSGVVVTMVVREKVVANFGACYPLQHGEIIAIETVSKAGRPTETFAVIRWEDGRVQRRVKLADIHEPGWRSAGGSPIGIFLAQA